MIAHTMPFTVLIVGTGWDVKKPTETNGSVWWFDYTMLACRDKALH